MIRFVLPLLPGVVGETTIQMEISLTNINVSQLLLILGEGNGNPLQYFCLGNPMDREAWQAIDQGVANSQTQLSNQTATINKNSFFRVFPSLLFLRK